MNKINYPNQESYKSALFITGKGKLTTIYCPFRVICVMPVNDIPLDTWVYVDAVVSHPEYIIAYLILNDYYPYNCFYLPINY